MSIIGAYPITLQYNDILEKPPTQKYIKSIVKGALMGQFNGADFSNHINQEFSKLLRDLKVNKKLGSHLQVTTVNIADRAKIDLSKHLKKTRNAQNYIAQSFSKYLSLNQNVSVLPYTKGYAIGNRMSARFASGDVFNLIVPDADYVINITLRGFKRKFYEQVSSAQSFIYGAYFAFEVSEPLTGKTYLNSQFMKADTQVIPNSQASVEDWPIYENLILTFFNSFTKELSDPSRSWVKEHSDNKVVLKELADFKNIVEQCK